MSEKLTTASDLINDLKAAKAAVNASTEGYEIDRLPDGTLITASHIAEVTARAEAAEAKVIEALATQWIPIPDYAHTTAVQLPEATERAKAAEANRAGGGRMSTKLTEAEKFAALDWLRLHNGDGGGGIGGLWTLIEAILTARLARVQALADQWNDTPDYTASAYDQGRVDQRHDMTTQLLEALEGPTT